MLFIFARNKSWSHCAKGCPETCSSLPRAKIHLTACGSGGTEVPTSQCHWLLVASIIDSSSPMGYRGYSVVTLQKRGWEITPALINVSPAAITWCFWRGNGFCWAGVEMNQKIWCLSCLEDTVGPPVTARGSQLAMERHKNCAIGGSEYDRWGSAVSVCNIVLFIHLTPYAVGKIAIIYRNHFTPIEMQLR